MSSLCVVRVMRVIISVFAIMVDRIRGYDRFAFVEDIFILGGGGGETEELGS